MPFMPEMVRYCGQRFEVDWRVERVCDTYNRAQWSVRMANTVYLDGLRCDGSAHGGCEAACRIFWHEAWLRRVDPGSTVQHEPDDGAVQQLRDRVAANVTCSTGESGVRYRCQATELPAVSVRISAKEPRRYLREYTSGNVTLPMFARVMARAEVDAAVAPSRTPAAGPSAKTPETAPSGSSRESGSESSPGRRSLKTFTDRGKNRGLWFDREMLAFCNTSSESKSASPESSTSRPAR